MRRRDFIGLVGGTAAVLPLVAYAQHSAQTRRIGVLIGYARNADEPLARESIRPFEDALREAGWVEGNNIHVDYRFGAGDLSITDTAAKELVTLSPDLIYAIGIPAVQAVQRKTQVIPIIFSRVTDPVGFGLVPNLNHPGGNITGFTVWGSSIGGKWIQLLRQIAPELRRVGVIYNPRTGPYAAPLIESAKSAAGKEMRVIDYPVQNEKELEASISTVASEPNGGLLVIPEPFSNIHLDLIISYAARFRLPNIIPLFSATTHGALISYSYAFQAMMRQPVSYIDRILKGDTPGDLPVQEPTKFELSINLRTAKELGLAVPASLLALADEVIE